MKKINLSSNHKRSVSSSIYLIEQLTDEIESALERTDDGIMMKLTKDIPEEKKKSVVDALKEIRVSLAKMAEKYQLAKHEIVQSQYVSARKAKIWEILNDTTSRRLKGFGDFPEEYAGEFDDDIGNLIRLVENI
ncbi:MAG: hypothetical protein GXO86_02995 [Chlorobi bacterium]|nr:hypothetical protein [Chlorobiota bacterium]